VEDLATLVERSLVAADHDDPPRYRLLETVRAFALEQLADAGESNAVRRAHAAALLDLFVRRPSDEQCVAEMANVRDALAWASANEASIAVPLCSRVTRVVGFTPWRLEATGWMTALEPAMRGAAGEALPKAMQADWWVSLAFVLNMRSDRAAAAAAQRGVAL